jgi:hypothetical protein
MNQQHERSWVLLAAVLVVFVALAAWYSVVIPLGEAPDEVPHFTYVRYLAQHGRLPTTEEEHEAFQPPLYYALGAALTFWVQDLADAPFAVRANAHFDVQDPRAPKNLLLHTTGEMWPYRGWVLAWRLVRLISIALGAIAVWATYRLGRVLFPALPTIPLTMAALVAFTPQFIFMSAVANNDNAATAFSALILWQVATLLHAEERAYFWRHTFLLGLLLGLGLLSKASLIALVPVIGLGIVVASKRQRNRVGGGWLLDAVGGLVLAFGLAALLAGWYFFRNWILHGDPMGWSFLLQINARREGPLTLGVLAWLFKGVSRSFWLGWIGIAFDDWIYWIIAIVCSVGLSGFFVWLIRRWRTMVSGTRWTLALLALQAIITVGSLVQWTATVLGTDQGRLVYPILPTVMLVIVVGWAWWARPRGGSKGLHNAVLAGLAGAMLLLAIITPGRYIGPVHAPAPMATEAELTAATPLGVDWGDVRLLGYRLESGQVKPGDKLVIHLYWQALQPVKRDYMALIQLLDQEGEFLMYVDGSPTAGRDTTDHWLPGVPLSSHHLLPVPEYGQPGDYRLTISLHPFGEPVWLPAIGQDGTHIGDHLVLPDSIQVVEP